VRAEIRERKAEDAIKSSVHRKKCSKLLIRTTEKAQLEELRSNLVKHLNSVGEYHRKRWHQKHRTGPGTEVFETDSRGREAGSESQRGLDDEGFWQDAKRHDRVQNRVLQSVRRVSDVHSSAIRILAPCPLQSIVSTTSITFQTAICRSLCRTCCILPITAAACPTTTFGFMAHYGLHSCD